MCASLEVGFVQATNGRRSRGQPASELCESALEEALLRLVAVRGE